jgi:hypothetical protein
MRAVAVAPWRQNPQRIAWVILLASFFLCSSLAVATPLLARSYLLHATQSRAAYITAMSGTVQLRAPGSDEPTAVTADRKSVREGSQITTDKTDRGLLVVVAPGSEDQALLTTQLYQDTSLHLEDARTPRFRWSQDPVHVNLSLDRGRIAVASAPVNGRQVVIQVQTPDASVNLGPGTFFVEIQGGETLVTSRFGTAQVVGEGKPVTVQSEERVSVKAGQTPDLPVPAAMNLVRNGTFDGGTLAGWQEVRDVAPGRDPGSVIEEPSGERQVVRFVRRNEDDAPNMVGIQQMLNRDIQGYDSLVVRLDLQLLNQSVPGGGYLSSEYPVMIDISYTDIYGKDLHWYHGFYYQDLPPGSNWKQPTGEKVPVGAWYTYESPNLMDDLRDTRPVRLNYIRISASGHDYESRVSNVALTAR